MGSARAKSQGFLLGAVPLAAATLRILALSKGRLGAV